MDVLHAGFVDGAVELRAAVLRKGGTDGGNAVGDLHLDAVDEGLQRFGHVRPPVVSESGLGGDLVADLHGHEGTRDQPDALCEQFVTDRRTPGKMWTS
ncbi:hypothetical protein [Streptomyces sp. NPDC047000]|uniref:hypothetical protein n=1 Tax=Streptomyces sp. NPDC047000 TaxID=3155474 RepID=UPI00340151EE